jgi:flavin-dependent dehydrogenase
MDKAVFPRDKVCAGWVTPQVFEDLRIDPEAYGNRRTLQPISGFRVGIIGGQAVVEAAYDRTVSYGIRRCEFDDFLLRRSGARLRLGESLSGIRRDGRGWIVNRSLRAAMLVGAGGHFCPIARALNAVPGDGPVVAAQEAEVPLDRRAAQSCNVDAKMPELYFCPDFSGYGWCVRKGDYLNVGFGRRDARGLPGATAAFLAFLTDRRRIPLDAPTWRWRGHAYRLWSGSQRRCVDDAVMLVGDAAGLAWPESGEGIGPAVESGLMAAAAIARADGLYGRDRLDGYRRDLHQRFGLSRAARLLSRISSAATPDGLARRLLANRWFVRHVVIDRWFLHARVPPLTPA